MSEGDIIPRPHRPKPLTKKQLLELKKRFADTDKRLDEIKKLEKKQREKNIENPDWV